ncbi:tyrosine-protein phosphatase [Microbacterium sp. MYb62]|uniref:tyrosine-protein phosphatase n=1 Tax=Microbacterium sp. MYb62 TaxID=1848690 RepID=UPI000CFCE1CD|nr:tyrosine-protein phosphatase [Microbacterium sp. MYb62]PRB15587.1 protein tyrosine phosphatase [Microbacterium sp. MYb62]
MTSTLDRRIPLRSAPNFRDLGGLPAAGGVVRSRSLYRSATLARLEGDDLEAFRRLDIGTVYDLRTAGERSTSPDHLPDGVKLFGLDVLADSTTDVAAGVGRLASDPAALAASLGDGRGAALMRESYRNIVSLPSALAAYRSFYFDLIDPARSGAALFHCTTGKDRTGWAAASFLLLLGVGEDDVRADYLETNADLLPALQPLLAAAADRGVDTQLLLPVLGVRGEYLDDAIDEARTRFGSIEGYATEGLGLNESDLDVLRRRFVVPQV